MVSRFFCWIVSVSAETRTTIIRPPSNIAKKRWKRSFNEIDYEISEKIRLINLGKHDTIASAKKEMRGEKL